MAEVMSVVAMLRGRACFAVDGKPPTWLAAGDVALLRGPDHYLFADDPATPPQAIIHPGQRCMTPDGQDVPQMRSSGVRRWGNASCGATEILTGTCNLEGEVSRRLLDALPRNWCSTLASLARETRVSRATLARRFSRVVGQPPMEYLTEWRLTLAADLILDPAETLGRSPARSATDPRTPSVPPSSVSAASGPAITAAPENSAPTPPSAAAGRWEGQHAVSYLLGCGSVQSTFGLTPR
jgi:AraC-like DNA-binding protein